MEIFATTMQILIMLAAAWSYFLTKNLLIKWIAISQISVIFLKFFILTNLTRIWILNTANPRNWHLFILVLLQDLPVVIIIYGIIKYNAFMEKTTKN